MKFGHSRVVSMLLAIALSGCAGATATQKFQSAPVEASRPALIVVYPFAVTPSEVKLNQGIVQRAYRAVTGKESAEQLQTAHDTADNLCKQVAGDLSKKGYKAVCQNRGEPVSGANALVVDGQFTKINEGNRLRRLVIGFGAGESTMDTNVQVAYWTNGSYTKLLDFITHADSGKMPGAVVMGPAGAAAGGSAAVIVGANAAVGGVKTLRSSTGFLTNKTAAQIVDSVLKYFAQRGWSKT